MTPSPRLLFHSPSRRGLGHVMRSANLARATVARDHRAAVLVQVSNGAAGQVLGDDVPWVAEDHTLEGRWAHLLETFRPSLVVFDTLLPGDWASDDVPRAFVWRRCNPERHRAIANDPRLQRMRLVIVPHAREESAYDLPAAIAERTVYTGPIVRPSTFEGQARVRERYGLDDDMVVVSTLGGGGFDESATWLLSAVLAAHEEMAAQLVNLRHILVLGPMSGMAAPPAMPKLTVVGTEPDLVDLFALADMVVAEAGYNTVHELRQLGVPTLFVPGDRTFDDQTQRAEALARRGLARVTTRTSQADAVRAIVELATDERARLDMRTRAQRNVYQTGNATAAAALLDAAR